MGYTGSFDNNEKKRHNWYAAFNRYQLEFRPLSDEDTLVHDTT